MVHIDVKSDDEDKGPGKKVIKPLKLSKPIIPNPPVSRSLACLVIQAFSIIQMVMSWNSQSVNFVSIFQD